MYENLSYEKLKKLPCEQKKNALMELKGKYPHYKEMAEKIGGTPAALANLYLRIVEGRKFGRKKKVEIEPVILEAAIENEVKLKRSICKSAIIPDSKAIVTVDEQKEIIAMPSKKTTSFTINLEINETGNEAKNRIEGILGSLLKDKIYGINLSIEEV